MAPSTKQYADSNTKQHMIGNFANSKVLPHKRRSARSKYNSWCTDDVEVEISTNPAPRMVSIEKLAQPANGETANGCASRDAEELNTPFHAEGTKSSLRTTSSSRSLHTLVSPSSSPRSFPRSSSTPTSLKRRAPSMCLASLLSQHSTAGDSKHNNRVMVTPNGEDTTTGVWGHFVELHQDDEQQQQQSTTRRVHPTRQRRRRPIIRGPNTNNNHELDGFFLTVPDMDEAVDQLRNLSF